MGATSFVNVTCAWVGAVCAVAPVAVIARAVAAASRPSPAALKNRGNEKSVLIVNLPTLQKTARKASKLKPSKIVRFSTNHVKFVNLHRARRGEELLH